MADTELPWQMFGRRIRPYALAVSLASFTVALALLLRRNDAGDFLDRTVYGYTMGGVALTATALLWWGWWARSDRLMQTGLLLTAGVFAARWFFLSISVSFALPTALLSLCWVVASAGAYLLERTTAVPR